MDKAHHQAILIVEDDVALASNVFCALEEDGYELDIAYNARSAMQRIEQDHFDAVVLDIGLPDMDGYRVVHHIREILKLHIPILILSARNNIEAKIAGFTHGADDYLTKPFSLVEVSLRMQALLRRAHPRTGTTTQWNCGALQYQLSSRTVCVHGQPVKLTKKSLQILELLMRESGAIVSRAKLEQHLWHNDPPHSDALRSQMHLLRKSLSECGFSGIETLHGLGWRIVAEHSTAV